MGLSVYGFIRLWVYKKINAGLILNSKYRSFPGLKTFSNFLKLHLMSKFRTYAFEKLEVWQEARKLVVKIYRITGRFPLEEKYGLTSQMRRAVTSVSNNIAEGTSRYSPRDQSRFTEISFGSFYELLNDTIHSFDLGFIDEIEYFDLRMDYDRIGPMIDGLRKSQIKRIKS